MSSLPRPDLSPARVSAEKAASTPPVAFPRTTRWLQVVSHLEPRYGGLSSAVPVLARKLAEYNPEGKLHHNTCNTSIAAFCAPGEHFRPAGFSEADLSFWPASRRPWLRNHPLRAQFEQELRRADAVHIHGLWEQSTALAAATARKLGKPYLISAHGMLEPWALGNKRLKKLVYAYLVERENVSASTCLHALTHAEAGQYRSFGARSPIAVIPNAVEVPAQRSAEPFFNLYPALRGKRLLLFMSRLHPKKGLDLLLGAWTSLTRDFPDAHLVLAGPDFEGTQAGLEAYIGRHALGSSVTFTGMLRETMKWSAISAAEAFVLPSHSEGFSVALLEAMGAGLPVIATRACNIPEVVEYGAGWQVEPAVPSLAQALTELLNNPHLKNQEIGARGAGLVQSRYSWSTITRQYAELYQWAEAGASPTDLPPTLDILFHGQS